MVAPPEITKQDTYPLYYEDAAKILGLPFLINTGYGRAITNRLARRLRQNYSKADLMLAVQEAKRRIDGGNRWRRLRMLTWIWGAGLPELIEGAHGQRGGQKGGRRRSVRDDGWAEWERKHK